MALNHAFYCAADSHPTFVYHKPSTVSLTLYAWDLLPFFHAVTDASKQYPQVSLLRLSTPMYSTVSATKSLRICTEL